MRMHRKMICNTTHLFIILLVLGCIVQAEVPKGIDRTSKVKVNKCCEKNEIYIGKHCVKTNKTSEEWRPLFVTEKGVSNQQINYTLVIGRPDCGHVQTWPIYHYYNSTDRLRLLPNGILRHYFDHIDIPDAFDLDNINPTAPFYDYEQGKYCIDKFFRFRMFVLLMLVMTLKWLFFLASFTKYEALVNAHIFVNTFEGPLILYVCIFNQKHIAYLLQKTCCYTTFPCCKPHPEVEWGDEMTAMNTLNNY
uniref:Probable G-protein coupled receptor Mth-like 5 n=1 Tax=Diabrotica virgifera virgifera TaxID=50390 RepID=A0A6P7G6G2_DIAVI